MQNIFVSIITILYTLLPQENIAIPNTNIDSGRNTTNISQQITEQIFVEDIEPLKATKQTNTTTKWWGYPEDIKQTTRSGNDLLVLVNKEYQLPQSYAPSDLVKASESGIGNGSGYYLRSILINDLKEMVLAAKADGITLSMISGYRSYQTQVSTYAYWVKINGVDGGDKISARPGHSQHQLGTAVDFGLGSGFTGSPAANWLANNSYKYGFVISYPSGYEAVTGYSYESWHYRYIGKTYAQEMVNSGMILENYLRSKN